MKTLHGISASPGLAIGTASKLSPAVPVDITARRTCDTATETARLDQAIQQSIVRLDALRKLAHHATAEILEAQREMLDDPELKQGAVNLITEGFTAEAAITRVTGTYAEELAALPDPYLAARAEDIHTINSRIVAELQGVVLEVQLDRASILVARDLAPAETVGLDPALLQAIITETGSATGHLAIVAQGLGIPAVVGVIAALTLIDDDATLVVDGDNGTVIINPDTETLNQFMARLTHAKREKQALEVYKNKPGLTADGIHIEVFANIGSLAEAQKAVEMGAEGVGLFRTELLAAQGLPLEEAQYAIYTEVAATLQRPLIIRTFDIGGDKPVPGLNIPIEANPFLGWRGIRLALDRPEEVFLPQIRAILRVAINHDLRIMLPMIVSPQEVATARTLIDGAYKALEQAGQPARRVPIGIMVETPAAAITLDQFVGLIDFASIGTNDLVQYTYAVDRTNPHVRDRAKPLGTAILRLIAQICQAGVPIAICGQLAGAEDAIPLLVGLGIRELSVAPARIPSVKHILSTMTLTQMQDQSQQALKTFPGLLI